MISFFKSLYDKIYYHLSLRSSEAYISFLRSKGVLVGEGSFVLMPKTVTIDYSRPTLLTIGNNVRLNKGLTILTHDFVSKAFVNKFCEFIPSSAPVHIGDNVYFGQHCTVLKGVTIGPNCIIGYGSLVTNDIPENSVAVGRPAKVVCSFDLYFEKRKKLQKDEAVKYALSFYERGLIPTKEDFYDDYPIFVDGENYKEYDYPYSRVFSPSQFEEWKKNHKKEFNGFDDFMAYVNKVRTSNKTS